MSTERAVMIAPQEEAPQALSRPRYMAVGHPAGMLAMAELTEDEFEHRLASLRKGQERINTIKRTLMKPAVHFGNIPGTDKPTLLKPGAEVLLNVYGLRADFIDKTEHGDGITAPMLSVTVRAEIHVGDLEGPVVAVGVGAANSWEKKYRYRRGERACPECGAMGQVKRSGFENRDGAFAGLKGWYCRDCNAKWANPKEPLIVEQQVGDIENPDQLDLHNTLLKMAKKRAHIDGALSATSSSDLFTQDLDETEPVEPAGDHDGVQAPKAGPTPAPATSGPRRAQAPTRTAPASGDKPACPKCRVVKSVILSKRNVGSFYCFPKIGGCGHDWNPGAPAPAPVQADPFDAPDSLPIEPDGFWDDEPGSRG